MRVQTNPHDKIDAARFCMVRRWYSGVRCGPVWSGVVRCGPVQLIVTPQSVWSNLLSFYLVFSYSWTSLCPSLSWYQNASTAATIVHSKLDYCNILQLGVTKPHRPIMSKNVLYEPQCTVDGSARLEAVPGGGGWAHCVWAVSALTHDAG